METRSATNPATSHSFAENATCKQTDDSLSSSRSREPISQKQWPPAGVRWFYSDEHVAIAHGDCREILPGLPKCDLLLTDPPYGIGYGGKENRVGGTEGRAANGWRT